MSLQYTHAGWFAKVVRSLKDVECISNSLLLKEIGFPADTSNEHLTRLSECWKISLEGLISTCDHFNLANTQTFARQLWDLFEENKFSVSVRQLQPLNNNVHAITARFIDELKTRTIFVLSADEMKFYYPTHTIFSDAVVKTFPTTSFDIEEAGNCFALKRYTACVFHLMRVLEIGLVALGKEFFLSIEHTNWNEALELIEKKIRNINKTDNKPTNWKSKQEQYSQIISNFMIFKDAWRNYTAHTRGRYSEEEADLIFRSVKLFMNKLATFIDNNAESDMNQTSLSASLQRG